MKKPDFSLDSVLADVRSIASTGKTVEIKIAEAKAPETTGGSLLRKLAADLRSYDPVKTRQEGLVSVLNGELPNFNVKLASAGEITVKPGANTAETLRNLAYSLRITGGNLKEAALRDGYNQVRGMAALKSLELMLLP